MDCNKVEALRAKETAERRFSRRDFRGAMKYAVKAQKLYPELEGITQMLATFDVYAASANQVDGEVDFYSVLGVTSSANEEAVRRQYKKLALILHPDKNKTVGADGAFKLVSEAWALLSDNAKRASYDIKRSRRTSVAAVFQPAYYPVPTHGVNGFNSSKPINPHNQPKPTTFWTVCTSCKVQYEYYRKYLNHKLTCKNCRKAFMAYETVTPANGSSSYCSWTVKPEYGHVTQVTLVPADTIIFSGAGAPGFPPGVATPYQNVTFQSSTIHGASSIIGAHGLVGKSAPVEHRAKEKRKGKDERMKNASNHTTAKNDLNCNMASSFTKPPPPPKADKPRKRRKVNSDTSRNGHVGPGLKTATAEVKMANGNGKAGQTSKVYGSNEVPARRHSIAPAFDARQLLIQKAQTAIRAKLAEVKLAAAASTAAAAAVPVAAAEEEKAKASSESSKAEELQTIPPKKELRISADLVASADQSIKQSEDKEPGSISIDVPDPDFHDFDIERTEDCFKPKQIWALYDEEDGMPRLYCLIRQVLSLKPFKILISYLHSKNNFEFGLEDTIDPGYTKSCGLFRAGNIELVDQVNIFSHVMRGGKGLRGGGVQIFPKKGDIWAIYRNWLPDGRTGMIPEEVKHQYDMVEVLDDYSEALGVCVAPLVKVNGFRTVYQRKTDQNAIHWIPRREMLRLSHQVPSWLITGQANLPNGCCDLDPAATPEELLQVIPEVRTDKKSDLDPAATPEELLQVIPEVRTDKKSDLDLAATPEELLQVIPEVRTDNKPDLDPAATPEELLQVIPEVRTDNKPDLHPAATPEELLQVIPEVRTNIRPASISEQ